MRIGIPKALLYYKYHSLWKTFIESLGHEVVLSPDTTKRTVRRGVEQAENEVCVPVKVFYGHVIDLKDKVDALFIPRVVSSERDTYTCPKFMGLPDMIRATDPKLPPVIAPSFSQRDGLRAYYKTFEELGAELGAGRAATLRAYLRSHAAYRRQHSARSGASGGERTDPGSAEKRMSYSRQRGAVSTDLRIGLIGHPYNIFDPFISMNVIDRLEAKGVTVRTSDTVAAATVNREDLKLPKALFWSYEKEIVGAAFNWLRTGEVDGIIYILSFACGPDSLIQVLVEKEAKRWPGVPIMSVVIDEHTGEAGLVTRLEAFLDMLDRKKCRPALTAN